MEPLYSDMSSTPSRKIAVDQTAKDYWALLFEEYGKMMTREIPRRIRAALGSDKTASAGAPREALAVVPLAKAEKRDSNGKLAGLKVEGYFVRGKGKNARRGAFVASFNGAGELKSFEPVEIK